MKLMDVYDVLQEHEILELPTKNKTKELTKRIHIFSEIDKLHVDLLQKSMAASKNSIFLAFINNQLNEHVRNSITTETEFLRNLNYF